jgi:hypothetical protein
VGFAFPFSSELANSPFRSTTGPLPEVRLFIAVIAVHETSGMVLANRSPFVAQTRDKLAHSR